MSQDPIQVYENHSGPIPTPDAGGHIWAFVAYRDAEYDSSNYGYGHTEEDAIADFVRNEAEDDCANCTQDCDTSSDCILTSGNLSRLIKHEIDIYNTFTPKGGI